jgi:hypothetical protein
MLFLIVGQDTVRCQWAVGQCVRHFGIERLKRPTKRGFSHCESVLVTILRGEPRLMHHMLHAELETSSRQQTNQKHCWVSSIPAIF